MTIYVNATHFMYCVTYYVAVPPDHLWVDVKAEAFDYISNSPHVIVRVFWLLLSVCYCRAVRLDLYIVPQFTKRY